MGLTLFAIKALATLASATYTAKPCFEGNCEKCADSHYDVTSGVPEVTIYSEFTEKGYNSSSVQGGYNVWWDISQPDESCAILIYQAYSQGNSTANWGNVILETSRAGCFYAEMNGGQWGTQFCCGDGYCGSVQPGSRTTLAKGVSDGSQLASSAADDVSLAVLRPATPSHVGNSTSNSTKPAAGPASGTAVAPLGTAAAVLKNTTHTKSAS